MLTQREEQEALKAALETFRQGWREAVRGDAQPPIGGAYLAGFQAGLVAEEMAARSYEQEIEWQLRLHRGPPITPEDALSAKGRLQR